MLALVLLARRRADPGALAFVGLNPVVAAIVVGGHNDLLVGVALLAAVLAAGTGSAGRAGALGGLAVLVKVSAVLPLVAVVAWVATRYGWRPGVRAALTAVAVTAGGYALAGGTAALSPLHEASTWHSKASLWTFPVSWTERTLFGAPATHAPVVVAGAVIAAVVAVVVAAHLRDLDPAIATGAAAFVYLLCDHRIGGDNAPAGELAAARLRGPAGGPLDRLPRRRWHRRHPRSADRRRRDPGGARGRLRAAPS